MAGAGNPQNVQPTTMQAPTVSAPATTATGSTTSETPNVFNQSAGAYADALAGTRNVLNNGPDVGAFMNPFIGNVVDTTMQDMNRARQMTMNDIGAQATSSGAFGGSRHGVAEAESNRNFYDKMGQTTANLYNTGFNTALTAAQNQQGVKLNAAGQMGTLSNLGFGYGTQLANAQNTMGAEEQKMMQALIDAAKGQYGGATGAPNNALNTILTALGAMPGNQGTTTTTEKKGLMDYIAAGATAVGALCWVAREVYGEDDPRWTQFRHWLLTDAPKWLLKAYATHGEAVARVVKRVPILKGILRPLMDRARRAAGFEG